jgi:GxxExxY protein
MLYQELSRQVIASFIAVHKALGPGLLEAPYHNALYYELKNRGFKVTYNAAFPVFYNGNEVGEYFADLSLEHKIIIEVKSVAALLPIHRAQLVNYLRISGLRLGFLTNFSGSRVHWQRTAV